MLKNKRYLLLCLMIIFFQGNYIIGQSMVNITKNNITIRSALNEVENQTGYSVGYEENVLDGNQVVSLSVKNKSINEAMTEILANTNCTYTIKNKHIIIHKKNSTPSDSQVSGIEIRGTITDSKEEPLPGVSILLAGTSTGTTTDINGNFTMSVSSEKDILKISYIGYLPKDVRIDKNRKFSIVLQEDSEVLDEVVVVGYGAVRKSDLTGAIASIKADELPFSSSTLEQALVGHTPGVEIKQASGAPGSGTNIRIRGVNSIYASVSPLYVIDGYPASKDVYINPNDVESIEVLKDAASAAIYGSRASGGVILITTKRGTTGKPIIEYDFQYSIQQVSKKVEMLNAREYRDFLIDSRNAAYRDFCENKGIIYDPFANNSTRQANGASNTSLIPDLFFDFETNTPVDPQYDTDWQDAIFDNAPMQKHGLSVRGGNEIFKYMASIGYIAQDGVISPTYNDRLTARLNMDVQATKRLKFGVNFSTSYAKMREVRVSTPSWNDGIILSALSFSPQLPVYNEDGSYQIGAQQKMGTEYVMTNAENPVALAHEIEDYTNQYRTNIAATLDFNILPELVFHVNAGIQTGSNENRYYRPASVGLNAIPAGDYASLSRASRSKESTIDWLTEYTLNYTKTFGKHNINALGGFSMQRKTYDNFSASAKGFEDDRIPEFGAHGPAAEGNIYEATSSRPAWSLMSYFGRLLYSYNDRYIFTGSLRTDGCSRFGPDNRWGLFPSVAVGWNISNEDFFKAWTDNTTLKLRASYGVSGNNNIGNYEHLALISKGTAVFGAAGDKYVVSSAYPGGFTDMELGWEKTKQLNVGFDLGLFGNRISLIANYYNSETNDLLYNKQVSAITGSTSFKTNMEDAKLQNRGFDFQIDSRILTGEFKWNAGFNISFNKNKVLDLPESIISKAERNAISHITISGKPIGSFYGLVSHGIITEADYENILIDKSNMVNGKFPEDYVLQGPAVWDYNSVRPGDVKWKDVDGNKVITDDDREIIGDNYPDFTYGLFMNFSYKGFDLSTTFTGSEGGSVINFAKYYLWNMEGSNNQFASVKNRYIDANNPGDGWVYRANRAPTNKNTQGVSSYQVEDASFFRCSNITLGYTVPNNILSKIGISGLYVYGSIDNLFTITDYLGYNPDVDYKSGNLTPGVDWGTYPLSRVFSMGVKVKF